jgi:hypothetical protein
MAIGLVEYGARYFVTDIATVTAAFKHLFLLVNDLRIYISLRKHGMKAQE